MDNLQLFYLKQVECACEHALHGNIDHCLNICFELRLKPNLSLYVRALVNLTIADFADVQECSDKVKFAQEAHRLAQELEHGHSSAQSAVWKHKHARLLEHTLEVLQKTEREVKDCRGDWEYYQTAVDALQATAGIEDSMLGLELEEHEEHQGKKSIETWDIEGKFTHRIIEAAGHPSSPTSKQQDPNSLGDTGSSSSNELPKQLKPSAKTVTVAAKEQGLPTPEASEP